MMKQKKTRARKLPDFLIRDRDRSGRFAPTSSKPAAAMPPPPKEKAPDVPTKLDR